MANSDLLTLSETAEYLKISGSSVRRLLDRKKIGCYGESGGKKVFSIERHILPYLRSVENKKREADTKKEKRPVRDNNYQYKTGIFDNL